MADLTRETHGPNSMKGVDLFVMAYDKRVTPPSQSGEITHYLEARIHPEAKIAKGQTNLALVTKDDPNSPSGKNNSTRYSSSQAAAIKEAAGTNVVDLTNKAGEVVGKIYGIKADLIIPANKEVIANTKTLTASDFSIAPDKDGVDIRTRAFAHMAEAKAAAEATKAAAKTAAVEAPAVETPAAEAAAEAPAAESKPATKPKAARKPRVAKPELASVAADAVASSDEPELG